MSLDTVQRQLASHIRNPEKVAGPEGLEPRRLKIYQDLFYKNIENFIANGFPILRSLIADDPWHQMVRDFMVHHQCHTPYFLEISQEFLLYLQNQRQAQATDPLFMQELAHYEWVELALDVADEDVASFDGDTEGDLLAGLPQVSPLAWSLAYQFPVHKIGVEYQPTEAAEQPTFLIVYRNRQDQVGFMEANSVTARLLELLQEEGAHSGEQVLQQVAQEMQHPDPQQVVAGGLAILQQLQSLDIILGTK
ncbi:DNA-binding domain-containing protein [Oceanicoccus sagamiensis]|uniref:DUF2063 domain-containing protein n=1 Tax=Oceanicoccus sagamiensis TaxID=716816 RepID=A0A1X9NB75_9GAMM|nr:putative DNA-binding domain-containing protein [Oceanicoccus sagamiensis]ARN75288.1 DUF2063 domain-containing protein [Oceanicoccus sagamiensis]